MIYQQRFGGGARHSAYARCAPGKVGDLTESTTLRQLRRGLTALSACLAAQATLALPGILAPPTATATNANFCYVYWAKFDERCWYGSPTIQWAKFEKGENYTRANDMWVQESPEAWYAHATGGGSSACLQWTYELHGYWAIFPFEPTNAVIHGHIQNYRQWEPC